MKDGDGGGVKQSGDAARPLNGADKVTALLLAMGKPMADRIIKKFEDCEIRQLARCAARLPVIPEDVIEMLVKELDSKLDSSQELVGSHDGAQNLIAGVVSDDRVAEIMSELNGTASDRVWSKLASAADDKLTQFIANERPQVAAVVLSKLDVDKAATVMAKLSSEQRVDLSQRLLALKPVGDRAMQLISERLSDELFRQIGSSKEVSRHARLGAILTNLDQTQIVEVITTLEQIAPDDARRVQECVFVFEEIVGLTAEDRSRVFDEVPSDRVVMALREAAPELKELVLQSLSPRSRRLVEAELSTAVKVTSKAVHAAKRAIASLAMDLAERSIIRLRPGQNAAGAA